MVQIKPICILILYRWYFNISIQSRHAVQIFLRFSHLAPLFLIKANAYLYLGLATSSSSDVSCLWWCKTKIAVPLRLFACIDSFHKTTTQLTFRIRKESYHKNYFLITCIFHTGLHSTFFSDPPVLHLKNLYLYILILYILNLYTLIARSVNWDREWKLGSWERA